VPDADAEPLPPEGEPRTEWVAPAEVVEVAAEIAAEEQARENHLDAPEEDAPGALPTVPGMLLGNPDGKEAIGEAGDGPDPLSPLTPEERFAAARLLDPESQAARFVLQFSTGESTTVYGAGLIGRNPMAEPGEYVEHLVVIRDPGRSVSKTHLEFGQDSGTFWVLDRFSGNGSVLREPDAAPRRCEPGRRYPIPRGSRVDIGDQFFVVS
jgi:hypothetical protein